MTVSAGGFAPGESVAATLHSTPRELAGAVADETGLVRYRLLVPFDLEPGPHRLELVGASRTQSLSFTALGPATSSLQGRSGATAPAALPSTGGGWLPKAFFAVLLLWLGLILLRHSAQLRQKSPAGHRRRSSTRGTT